MATGDTDLPANAGSEAYNGQEAHHEPATLDVAMLCRAGGKTDNEDAADYLIPSDTHQMRYKGSAFVVADGVSSAEAGQQASQTAVTSFLREYPSTPDTWSASHSAEQLLSTINSRLYRHSHAYTNELKGHLCTFSSLIIKSRTAHVFHVGDSRVYHVKNRNDVTGSIEQLTRDHKAQLSKDRSFLARALGMDNRLQIDYRSVEVSPDELFILSTDGLHDFIDQSELCACIEANYDDLNALIESLYELALANDCDDNVSIIAVRVDSLPKENIDDFNERLTRLPFPPALKAGMKLDDFEVVKPLFMSSRSHLYLVRDTHLQSDNQDGASGDSTPIYVMKAPSENYSDDPLYIERFIREEWVGSRIQNQHVVRVIRPDRAKTFQYYLMEYIEGQSLEQLIADQAPLPPAKVLRLLEQIHSGLQAFHDCETIHQDLKPGNILINKQGVAKIVDFGSVYVAGLAEVFTPLEHDHPLGTAEYSDPQYLMGKNSGIQGDVYALATIAYELFTGGLPYGPTIAECRTPRDYERLRYISAREVNPKIPVWLDRALQKGANFDLQQRYTTLDALLADIRRPNPEFLKNEVKKDTRNNSLLFWQFLSGFWFVTLLLVIYLFVLSR